MSVYVPSGVATGTVARAYHSKLQKVQLGRGVMAWH